MLELLSLLGPSVRQRATRRSMQRLLRVCRKGMVEHASVTCCCLQVATDLDDAGTGAPGLHTLRLCSVGGILSTRAACPSPSCGLCSSSGWVPVLCQLSKAGFQSLECHAIFVAARFVAPGLSVMSAVISLNAQNLMTSEPNMLICMRALQVPCALLSGTMINRLSVIA